MLQFIPTDLFAWISSKISGHLYTPWAPFWLPSNPYSLTQTRQVPQTPKPQRYTLCYERYELNVLRKSQASKPSHQNRVISRINVLISIVAHNTPFLLTTHFCFHLFSNPSQLFATNYKMYKRKVRRCAEKSMEMDCWVIGLNRTRFSISSSVSTREELNLNNSGCISSFYYD